MGVISKKVSDGRLLTAEQAHEVVAKAMPEEDYRNSKVLIIVPDGTRTAPVGMLFKAVHEQVGGAGGAGVLPLKLGGLASAATTTTRYP